MNKDMKSPSDNHLLDSGLLKNSLSNRQRASDIPPDLQGLTRTQARDQAIIRYQQGELSQGQLLKTLRLDVLGVKQIQFAKMVKVSRKTLSDVENDMGNYSVNTLNQIFRPFGLVLGLQVKN